MTHKKLLERNRKITDALHSGVKVTELAKEYGLTPQSIYHIAQAEMVNNPRLKSWACGNTSL